MDVDWETGVDRFISLCPSVSICVHLCVSVVFFSLARSCSKTPLGHNERSPGPDGEDRKGGGKVKGKQERHEDTKVRKERFASGIEVIPATALVR